MTDRLEIIKRLWARDEFRAPPSNTLPQSDIDWLIAEVERLRAHHVNLQQLFVEKRRELKRARLQHARDIKTSLANKEIRP